MSGPQGWFRFDAARATIHLGTRSIVLPKSRLARVMLATLFILGGMLWFLPVLGAWMLPIGLLILSLEFAIARRWRRRFVVWWENRNRASGRRD